MAGDPQAGAHTKSTRRNAQQPTLLRLLTINDHSAPILNTNINPITRI